MTIHPFDASTHHVVVCTFDDLIGNSVIPDPITSVVGLLLDDATAPCRVYWSTTGYRLKVDFGNGGFEEKDYGRVPIAWVVKNREVRSPKTADIIDSFTMAELNRRLQENIHKKKRRQ